jgi:hypothetical protein
MGCRELQVPLTFRAECRDSSQRLAAVAHLRTREEILPPHERFAYWQEARAKNIFGATIELEQARQPAFQGTFSAIKVGEATLVELHASPYQVSRSWAEKRGQSTDLILVAHRGRDAEIRLGISSVLQPDRWPAEPLDRLRISSETSG